MREIWFRGQTRRKGQKVWMDGTPVDSNWVEGYGVCMGKGDFSVIYSGDHVEKFSVYTDTVGQFTGLTDKNGKKIFEGDLLNGFQYPFYRSESAEHNYFAEVIWFTGNCAFCLYTHKHPTARVRGISAGNADFIEDFNSDDWEVIGNIHDNPELLGGAEDGK